MATEIESTRRYTEREAAEILGVSRATLYELRRSGEIRHMKWLRRSIRYKGSYLTEYISRCERAAEAHSSQRRGRGSAA